MGNLNNNAKEPRMPARHWPRMNTGLKTVRRRPLQPGTDVSHQRVSELSMENG
jgi:hypothetical protein